MIELLRQLQLLLDLLGLQDIFLADLQELEQLLFMLLLLLLLLGSVDKLGLIAVIFFDLLALLGLSLFNDK